MAVTTRISDQADLSARVAAATAKAAIPAYERYVAAEEIDVEAWNHVGDPLAEALVNDLRKRKAMGGDLLRRTRREAEAGLSSAVAFLADVNHVPAWVDFEAMRPGAAMAARHPVPLIFGIHGSLPLTYVDPATAAIMGSTGRLSGERGANNFDRRFWETASGFAGTLDVDAMKPGGAQWEKWVRIRLLHTMIRLGILRSGSWDHAQGMPISQIATGSGAYMFGDYRVNMLQALGGYIREEERHGFHLMWRWVARLEGTNSEVLGPPDQQARAMERIFEHLYAPNAASRELTGATIDGLASMPVFGPISRRMHAAIVRHLMNEKTLDVIPGIDVPADLGLPPDRVPAAALGALVALNTVANQAMRVPAVRSTASRWGHALVTGVVEQGLGGKPAQFLPEPTNHGDSNCQGATDEHDD